MLTQTLLAQFAERFGINDLLPDENGVYDITFDGTHLVQILAHDACELRLQSRVGRISEDPIQRENTLMEYLRRVTARQSKVWRGCETLAFDSEQGEFIIYTTVATQGIDVDCLCEIMEEFVNAAEFWADADSPRLASDLQLAFLRCDMVGSPNMSIETPNLELQCSR